VVTDEGRGHGLCSYEWADSLIDSFIHSLAIYERCFNCFPCSYGMERPQVAAKGKGLKMWRLVANTLNKQSHTLGKRGLAGGGAGISP
jgi:hypothetical protein